MDNDQITALAREYAEFTDTSDVEKKHISAICECFLKYTLRRYCLVEKSEINKLLDEHRKESKGTDKGGREWFFYYGRLDLLKSLFPDLGKEME